MPQTNMSVLNDETLGLQSSPSSKCPLCGHYSTRHQLLAADRFHSRTKMYVLVRCGDCGLVWLVDPPSPQEMPRHYSDSYHQAIENGGEVESVQRWQRQCNEVQGLSAAGGTILDIGCSSGAFLRTLGNGHWRRYGVEISKQMAERARVAADAEVFIGDPLDAPFENESFDVITCFHLLEHVHRPFDMLARVRAWLKPGGFFYVMLPNIDSWEARIFQSYWYGLELPRHIWHFSPPSLEFAANAAGMRTVRLGTLAQDSFSEHSCHYIFEDLLGKCGISMHSLAAGSPTSFAVKSIRKAFRVSIESGFRHTAHFAGCGASIEGVFVKESAGPRLDGGSERQ